MTKGSLKCRDCGKILFDEDSMDKKLSDDEKPEKNMTRIYQPRHYSIATA